MRIIGTWSPGDRSLVILLAAVIGVGVASGFPAASDERAVGLGTSYAEWRRPGELIVDGQRIHASARTTWRGGFASIDAVPLGYEVRVTGARQRDGTILAREIDVRQNSEALFDAMVERGTNELEQLWLRSGQAFEGDVRGRRVVLGAIDKDGHEVERVRRIVRRLAPPYLDAAKLRVYVIDNKDWNALAMGNGAIWVFRGMLNDMSDNALAIVIGHELAHYTHEHSRRQLRNDLGVQLAAFAASLAVGAIDSNALQLATQLGASLGFSAYRNGYGRDLEDQADRVGLRYAFEGGFDVSGAPDVWQRFLEKYGEGDRVTTFFFGDHSRASSRRQNLEAEIANNYAR